MDKLIGYTIPAARAVLEGGVEIILNQEVLLHNPRRNTSRTECINQNGATRDQDQFYPNATLKENAATIIHTAVEP